jgi:uncharacterized protein
VIFVLVSVRVSKIFIAAGLCVAALVGMAALAVEAGVSPGKRSLGAEDRARVEEMARSHGAELRDVQIAAKDGAVLKAWLLVPGNFSVRPDDAAAMHSDDQGGKRKIGARDVVIAFHGVADNRLSMVPYAEMFLRHGYAVVLPDARAHGVSGGAMATFGLFEADDDHRWVDFLEAELRPQCVYGLGESMGAAGLLQSLGSETRYCAVVAESGFSSFREVSYDRVGQFFHTGPWLAETLLRPVVEGSFLYARWKYQLNFGEVSAERAVSETQVPVMVVHGLADLNIPIRHARKIAAANSAVVLWEVPEAGHCGAFGTAPEEFERRVVGWFGGHGEDGAVKTRGVAARSRQS